MACIRLSMENKMIIDLSLNTKRAYIYYMIL